MAIIYEADGSEYKAKKSSAGLFFLILAIWLIIGAAYLVGVARGKRLPQFTATAGTAGTSRMVVASDGWQFNTLTASTATAKRITFNTPPPIVPAPSDHPPLNIVVGAFTYRVRYTTSKYLTMKECGAYTESATHEIWMSRSDTHPRDTMMHELLHVAKLAADEGHIRYYDPVQGGMFNHDYIGPAAPSLLALIQHNPKLMEWLAKEPHIEGDF